MNRQSLETTQRSKHYQIPQIQLTRSRQKELAVSQTLRFENDKRFVQSLFFIGNITLF
jgi:hypothetical protein